MGYKKGGCNTRFCSKKTMRFSSYKKAQITAFIIIGFFLIAGLVMIMYVKEKKSDLLTQEIILSSEPVTAYVQVCLKELSEEAITLLSQQGGYISTDRFDTTLATYAPFESEVLTFANGKMTLPYWFYQHNERDVLAIPTLTKEYTGDGSIQDQLELYISYHIFDCLRGFEPLKEQGINVLITGEPIAEVSFTEAQTHIALALPLQVTQGSEKEQKDAFELELPIALKRIYSLATEITLAEVNTQFLERNTRNLITVYSDADSKYLPPVTQGLVFTGCGEFTYWYYDDVKEDLKTVLTANVPYLSIKNTASAPYQISGEDLDQKERTFREAVFNHMQIPVSKTSYPTITTSFAYNPTFPLELDLGSFGIIKPNVLELNMVVTSACMFDYTFIYDIKYPVMVTLQDEESRINNHPLQFQFPLQVILKNNNPRVQVTDLAEGIIVPEVVKTPTYQCDPKQRLSKDITIRVTDDQKQPLDDVVVLFQCGPSYVQTKNENGTITGVKKFAESCYMGQTEKGTLTTKFPPCGGGGMVTLQNPETVRLNALTGSIDEDASMTLNYELPKIYTKTIELRKFFVKPAEESAQNPGIVLDEDGSVTECNIYSEEKPLQPYEEAIISITKLDEGELNRAPVVHYLPNETVAMDIAPGKYLVEITLMRNERYAGELTIKAKSQSMTVPNGTFSSTTIYYPEEDVLMETVMTGGLEFIWEPTSKDLQGNATIVLYSIDEGIPVRLEEVNAPLTHRDACAALNQQMLMPKVGSN